MRLLAAIDTTGSITRAAREAGISYKSAWDTLDAMNHLSSTPLVARATGGKGGGGTRLTQAGRDLLAVYHAIEAEQQRLLATLAPHVDDAAATLNLLSRLRTMRTSARNQFLGRVSAIHTGAVNDEIILELAGGTRLVAVITCESTRRLGLATGMTVTAAFKASHVILAVPA